MRWETALAAERVERKLAAILAADIAGYSRLMGADEEGTLARLKAHRRELIDPKIAEHRGRIVKTTGDGLLVEFASPVEAVRCAGEIQRAMREREGSLPEEQRIEIRVGINLGDVIIDEDDVSSALFEQLRDRVPDSFDEIKYDGYRMHARLDHGTAQLLTRTGLNWTRQISFHSRSSVGSGSKAGVSRWRTLWHSVGREDLVQHDPNGFGYEQCRCSGLLP